MTSTKTRINMRISEDNLALIREAADLTGQDMTSFVLSAALDRAREVIIETQVTRLTRDEAESLERTLERDAQSKPALAALLARTLDQDFRNSKSRSKVDA